MKAARGFIQLPAMMWGVLAAGVTIAGLGIAVKVQSARLDTCKAEYAKFQAEIRATGEAAIRAAKQREAEDQKRKEQADAALAKTRKDMAGVYAAYQRLRDQRAASGFLPPATAGSSRPDRACFNRAELERTLGVLDAEGAGIAAEGDDARVGLDAAKRWAATVP